MLELVANVGISLLEGIVSSTLDDIYAEYDLSSNNRSRRLAIRVNTDIENLSYEINLNFKSGPRRDGALK